jgi:hypothetical protein
MFLAYVKRLRTFNNIAILANKQSLPQWKRLIVKRSAYRLRPSFLMSAS